MMALGRNCFATARQNDLIAARSTIAINLTGQPRLGEARLPSRPGLRGSSSDGQDSACSHLQGEVSERLWMGSRLNSQDRFVFHRTKPTTTSVRAPRGGWHSMNISCKAPSGPMDAS